MTYISRRTRIIVSRWLDECDAEYTIRASRKRSDGRLKRHSSCDDLRAWVNDNCIKHEHLVDLMSDGEVASESPIHLYGRFIPVPILVQLLQSNKEATEETNEEENEKEKQNQLESEKRGQLGKGKEEQNMKNEGEKEGQFAKNEREKAGQFDKTEREKNDQTAIQCKSCVERQVSCQETREQEEKSESEDHESSTDTNTSLLKIQCEKYLLEKRLFECMTLLCKALKKLETIDKVACAANEASENMRNEEIQNSSSTTRTGCSCSSLNQNQWAGNVSPSKCANKLKESTRCTELLRKISCLREKLRKVQECREEINHQIRTSQQRIGKCASTLQVTELYSRREQAQIKRLQKRLERLITERGRLLSEMSQAINSLNNLKKSSRMNLSFRNRQNGGGSPTEPHYEGESGGYTCECEGSVDLDSSESKKLDCSESMSSEDSSQEECFETVDRTSPYSERNAARNVSTKNFSGSGNLNSGRQFGEENSQWKEEASQRMRSTRQTEGRGYQMNGASVPKSDSPKNTKKTLNSTGETKEGSKKKTATKKSRLKFVCPDTSCAKKLYLDNLADYPNYNAGQQSKTVYLAQGNFTNARPNTVPMNEQQRRKHNAESGTVHESRTRSGLQESRTRSNTEQLQVRGLKSNTTQASVRKVKSEMTMEEIEKTLRNYEQRLKYMDCLECKIEGMKQNLLNAYRLKEQLVRLKTEGKKLQIDRERSGREITKLCSENWELKRQVQQLTANFEIQFKKIQILRCNKKKVKDLEGESEELKQELSAYQNRFENQRKCISKLENIVSVQRTEIEKLMNHIRRLTTMNEMMSQNFYNDKKSIQRSRSYSPQQPKCKKPNNRPKTEATGYRMSSDEEEGICCCEDKRHEESKRRSQQRSHCPQQAMTRRCWNN